jgi:hypothetical protein
VCKEVVAALPTQDDLLSNVSRVLGAMGVVTGEFGFAEGLREKREQLEPWLEDDREPVRTFAARHIHELDNETAAEQGRAESELALRKLEYGAPDQDGEGAPDGE